MDAEENRTTPAETGVVEERVEAWPERSRSARELRRGRQKRNLYESSGVRYR